MEWEDKEKNVQTVRDKQYLMAHAEIVVQPMDDPDKTNKKSSTLYLLVNESRSLFKIGITDDLEARYNQLSVIYGGFDLASSCVFQSSRKDVHGLEKTLHYLLDKWRINPSPSVKLAGHTEWFSMTCFEQALEIISSSILIKGGHQENSFSTGICIPKNNKAGKHNLKHSSLKSQLRACELSRNIFRKKHGSPVYITNPSTPADQDISRPHRAQIGNDKKGLVINERPGEILGSGGAAVHELEDVDKERFVKLFLAGVKQAAGLSKAGLAIFEVVYNLLRDNPNTDKVILNLYVASEQIGEIAERTYQRGLRELLDKEFLYRSPSDGVFFVNIRYMFNGDRLAFVKAFHLAGSAPVKKAAKARKKRLPPPDSGLE